MAKELELEVLPQPDDSTCGPTCLHAVYRYWDQELPIDQVIAEVVALPAGGTLGVSLATHALRRGFGARIYTYNLQLFDPTWFARGADLAERLREQKRLKPDRKLGHATDRFLEFLELGGKILIEDLTEGLILRFLDRGIPVLTGLSATYLYKSAREFEMEEDDLRGHPVGHFVVLSGYDPVTEEVVVVDPLADNPRFGRQNYRVKMDHLIASILLGIVTYDANLVVIAPKHLEDPG